MVDNGIPCLSQPALLEVANDSEEALKEVLMTLVDNRVRPYHCFTQGLLKDWGISESRCVVESRSGGTRMTRYRV